MCKNHANLAGTVFLSNSVSRVQKLRKEQTEDNGPK